MSALRRIGCLLVAAGTVMACRVDSGATQTPQADGHAPRTHSDQSTGWTRADRGISYTSDEVRVEASWRSEVEPRGVVVIFPGVEPAAAQMVDLANRVLDAGFNVALVGSSSRSLAQRVEVAAMLANDKSLGQRQWLEHDRPRKATITVLLFDDRGAGTALDVLRANPPLRTHAAIVISSSGPFARHGIPSEDVGELRVLEVAVPDGGDLDEPTWAQILGFLAEGPTTR